MRKLLVSTLASALMISVGSILVKAEWGGGRPGGPMAGAGPDMANKLGLTDAQKTKFEDAAKAHRDAIKPLMEKMKASMQTLREQVDKKAPDADIKATLAALKDQRGQMMAEQEKYHQALAEFLTPTQQAMALLRAGPGAGRAMERGRRGRWGSRDRGNGGPGARPDRDSRPEQAASRDEDGDDD